MAPALAPMKRVNKKTDQYFIYDVAQQFRRNDLQRSNRGESKELELTELSTSSYVLKRYSAKTYVSEEDKMVADPAVNPMVDAVQELTDSLLREKELQAANAFFTSTAFTTNLLTLSSNAWSYDTTTSAPIDDADTAIQGIMTRTGQVANNLAIGKQTFDVLKDHSDILDRVKWSERGIISEDILASVLGIDKITVGKGIYRTTAEGISATTTWMFNSNAVFFYNTPNVRGKIANMGVTFSGLFGDTKPVIRQWFDDDRNATAVEMDWMFDIKMVLSLSGYFIAKTN